MIPGTVLPDCTLKQRSFDAMTNILMHGRAPHCKVYYREVGMKSLLCICHTSIVRRKSERDEYHGKALSLQTTPQTSFLLKDSEMQVGNPKDNG